MWSQVCHAGAGSQEALETLYRKYWYPIYVFLRRAGKGPEEAEDLTQGFFLHLQVKNLIGKADPSRGRFRSFLLGVLKNFVRDQAVRDRAIRRGGGAEVLSLDVERAEERYQLEQATVDNPEKLMDRRWALEVLRRAVDRLRTEFRDADRADEFEALLPFLTLDSDEKTADLAGRLGISEGNARVRLVRLRERFGKAVRKEVSDTVLDPTLVEEELEALRRALREE